MTRNIKGMITMKTSKLLTIAGACLALALAGCASTGGTKTAQEPLPDEEGKGGAAVTERETISRGGAEQIIPKEKKRNISADARADFEKAMKRYQDAKKGDGLSRSECSQRRRRVQARRRRQPRRWSRRASTRARCSTNAAARTRRRASGRA